MLRWQKNIPRLRAGVVRARLCRAVPDEVHKMQVVGPEEIKYNEGEAILIFVPAV